MNSSQLITLPARLAARGVGLARGTLSEGRRLVREAAAPAAGWPSTPPDRSAADGDPVAAGEEAAARHGAQGGPVNVHDELGLDPAPPTRRRTPRHASVTGIDQRAEPGLVESTPADVAARLERADDAGGDAEE